MTSSLVRSVADTLDPPGRVSGVSDGSAGDSVDVDESGGGIDVPA